EGAARTMCSFGGPPLRDRAVGGSHPRVENTSAPLRLAQALAQKLEPAALKKQNPVTPHDPRAGMCKKLAEDAGFQVAVDRLDADVHDVLLLLSRKALHAGVSGLVLATRAPAACR